MENPRRSRTLESTLEALSHRRISEIRRGVSLPEPTVEILGDDFGDNGSKIEEIRSTSPISRATVDITAAKTREQEEDAGAEEDTPLNNDQDALHTLQTPNEKVDQELEDEHLSVPLAAPQFAAMGMPFIKESTAYDVYNNEAKMVDVELVKDWTSSLNFLLLFAAIFSAILTAFIIESKKLLQEDPTDVMVKVLILYTNNMANGTHVPYKSETFEASVTSISINSLFFASLSASLVAALASVIALQWVADYDATISRGGASPQDRLKRRQFRFGGVKKWKMGEIIAALPVLLYFSVILFFAGLIQWMWSLHRTVGFIVLGGASLAISFYFVSALLAVVFPSSPFRTPISRWLYSFIHLLSIIVRVGSQFVGLTDRYPYLAQNRFSRSTIQLRDHDSILADGELAAKGLIWLSTHISLSADSHRRLLLLLREVLSLASGYQSSKNFQDAPWREIFEVLGGRYINQAMAGTFREDDEKGLNLLLQCLRSPILGPIIAPGKRHEYSPVEKRKDDDSLVEQVNGNPRSISTNATYFLLQNIQESDDRMPVELQLRHRVGHLRQAVEISKTTHAPPKAWMKVMRRYGNGQCSRDSAMHDLADLLFYLPQDLQQLYMIYMMCSLNAGYPIYHQPVILSFASRRMQSTSTSPVILRLQSLRWINKVDQYSNIRDILYSLAVAWSQNQELRPLWRFVADESEITEAVEAVDENHREGLSNLINLELRDSHLIEALQSFDSLIAEGCSEDQHLAIIWLVCMDLEGHRHSYNEYWTEARMRELSSIKDTCLRFIGCTEANHGLKQSLPTTGKFPFSKIRIVEHYMGICRTVSTETWIKKVTQREVMVHLVTDLLRQSSSTLQRYIDHLILLLKNDIFNPDQELQLSFPIKIQEPRLEYSSSLKGRLQALEWMNKLDQHYDSRPRYSLNFIHELLHSLQRATIQSSKLRPFWRLVATDGEIIQELEGLEGSIRREMAKKLDSERRNRRLVEAASCLDKLILRGCTGQQHLVIIKLLCQDLESYDSILYANYYTDKRKRQLLLLQDPCLRLIACAISGLPWQDEWLVIHPVHPYAASWLRASKYCFSGHSSINFMKIWRLKIQLWNYFPDQIRCNTIRDALQNLDLLTCIQYGLDQKSGVENGGDYLLSFIHHNLIEWRACIPPDQTAYPTVIPNLLVTGFIPRRMFRIVSHSAADHLYKLYNQISQDQTRLFCLLSIMMAIELSHSPSSHNLNNLKGIISVIKEKFISSRKLPTTLQANRLVDLISDARDLILENEHDLYDFDEMETFRAESNEVIRHLLAIKVISFGLQSSRIISCTRPRVGMDVAAGYLGMFLE